MSVVKPEQGLESALVMRRTRRAYADQNSLVLDIVQKHFTAHVFERNRKNIGGAVLARRNDCDIVDFRLQFFKQRLLEIGFLAISSAKDDIERSVASANPKMLGAFSVPERKPFSCPPPYKSGFIDVPFLRINRLYPSVREFCAMISNTNQRRARANSPLFSERLHAVTVENGVGSNLFGDFYEPCYIVDCARFVAYVHNRHKRHVFIE